LREFTERPQTVDDLASLLAVGVCALTLLVVLLVLLA
jgi:hypothetical protein